MTDRSTTAAERNGQLQPIVNVPGVITSLVAILVIIHLIRWLAGEQIYMWSGGVFSFNPVKLTDSDTEFWPGEVYWSFLSYALLHADWLHLLLNSVWLVVFGSVVARRLGKARFLFLSAICAVAGAAAMLMIYWGQNVYMVGASAAVSGHMAAAVPLMYGSNSAPSLIARSDLSRVRALSFRRLLTDRRPLMFMAVLLAIMLLTGTTDLLAGGEGMNIAWQAHIGGFVAGLLGFYLLDQGPMA